MQKNAPSGKLTTAERDASLDRCLSGIADEDPAALEELLPLNQCAGVWIRAFLKTPRTRRMCCTIALSTCMSRQRDTIPAASRWPGCSRSPGTSAYCGCGNADGRRISPGGLGRTAMVTPRMPARRPAAARALHDAAFGRGTADRGPSHAVAGSSTARSRISWTSRCRRCSPNTTGRSGNLRTFFGEGRRTIMTNHEIEANLRRTFGREAPDALPGILSGL